MGVIYRHGGGDAAPPSIPAVETAGGEGRAIRRCGPSGPRQRRRRHRALGVLGALLVVGTVGLPAPRITAAARADPTHGVVTVRANVRLGPSLQSPIAAVLPAGALVVVLEEQGAWSRIRTAAGLDAWVSQPLVRFGAAPPGPRAGPADTATARPLDREPLSAVIGPFLVPADAPDVARATRSAPHPLWNRALTAAFGVVLLGAIGLQLRAARQFKWAMAQLGAMLEVVEALSAVEAATRTSQRPPPSLSPQERAALAGSDAPGRGLGGGAGKTPPGPGLA